ncbi:RidA family protein [Nocardia sp. NPDC127579]|uniref:RidA family protein n=1 Tax=Nocardia sp. NPDC127579 TaxID=3345402 RepID=UPI0036275430
MRRRHDMSIDISNPAELHDPTGFGYSHVARVRGDLVFIAGQYDSDADGHTTSDDFATQVQRAFANLGVALRSAGLDYADVFQLRTFIVDHDLGKLEVLGKQIAAIWGDRPPVQTLSGVAALAMPDMLFEVDAVAAAS